MKKILLALIILCASLQARAQITYGTIDPTGACPGNGNLLYVNSTTNGLWWCSSNQWNTVPSWTAQVANKVFAGPTTGGAALPTMRNLVAADLPLPTASTVGGVQSYAAVSHQWINTVSVAGVFSSTQPQASDLTNGANGLGAVLLQQLVVLNKTANYNVSTGDSGKTITNAGAAGAIILNLPTCAAGLYYLFDINAAQTVTITATNGDKIRNAATLSAANGTAAAATIGNTITLQCIGTSPSEWDTFAVIGTWTVT